MSRFYMIAEEFRGGDAGPVYERLKNEGRKLPDGLRYVTSWVTADLTRCFQVMECGSSEALRAWIEQWEDLVRFDVAEVISSKAAQAMVALKR